MKNENTERWYESRIAFSIATMGVALTVAAAIFVPIYNLNTQVALVNQKLDSIITWENKHETDTTRVNDQLNLTFADIYSKLGLKYIPK